MKVLQITIFALIQIPFIPLTILGSCLLLFREVFVSRKLGVSATAIEVVSSRWILHVMGEREDPISVELAKHLPNHSSAGLWLAAIGVLVGRRITGYKLGIFSLPDDGDEGYWDFVNLRAVFFDEALENSLDHVEQVVFMGAGYDTRAVRSCQNDHLRVFELDDVNTQRVKIEALQASGVDTGFITFVSVDFKSESWYEKLVEATID